MEALRQPTLVAAWPGMGGVALIAATQLVQLLHMEAVGEVDPERFHNVNHVVVKRGLLSRPPLPRSTFHAFSDPQRRCDLLVLVGQQQPEGPQAAYCAALLDEAVRRGASRVVTFAAMSSFVDPRQPARVFAAATTPKLLDQACTEGAEPLDAGQIAGLNGAFLGAAAERGLPGLCLLGEIPFFASGVANPKAAAAALRVFARVAEVPLDLASLDAEAARIEQALSDHLRRLEQSARAEQGAEGAQEPEFGSSDDDDDDDEEADEDNEGDEQRGVGQQGEQGASRRRRAAQKQPASGQPQPAEPAAPVLAPAVAARIEQLFVLAAADRSKALELKAELDRHGAFAHFENRFLDLFRQGG